MKSNLKHWLVLTRCSNLPTVWSNVISGWLLGLTTQVLLGFYDSTVILPAVWGLKLFILLSGTSLLYVAGMILNDVYDYKWDCKNRSERPLPVGSISLTHAMWAGYLLLSIGAILCIFSVGIILNPVTVILISLLIFLILWYNFAHKGNPLAPIVMGGCRALLPLIGFNIASARMVSPTSFVFIYAIVLGIYTYALTWVAKYEVMPPKKSFAIERILFLIPLPLILYGSFTCWGLGAVIFYTLWIVFSNYRHPMPAGISARVADRIAAFSLLDMVVSGTILFLITPAGGASPQEAIHHQSVKEIAWLAIFAPPTCFCVTLGLRKFIPST